ncbi:MAG: hypothetical protein GTO62_15560, partial [Planctomycetales bacterium]|nr:hypothetical protein [Planctomycetales bacterium]
GLDFPGGATWVTAALDGEAVAVALKTVNGKRRVVFEEEIELIPGQVLQVRAAK